MENNQVVKQSLTTEKPDFFSHDSSKGDLPSQMPNYVSPLGSVFNPDFKQSLTNEKPKQNMNAANTFVGGVKPSNNKPKTEKPKYLKHKSSYLTVKWEQDKTSTTFKGEVVVGDLAYKNGEVSDKWYKSQFEPCNYTEPVGIEHPVKGVNTDIDGNPITAKGLVDWCKAYSKVKEKPVEVFPEAEQPFEFINQVGGSKIVGIKRPQPSAEYIAHAQKYSLDMEAYLDKLEQENTELKADNKTLQQNILSYVGEDRLRAEKAELEAENLKARHYMKDLTELLGKSQMTIADLEAQLAAKNELLSNAEQLPVYDADWLANTVNNYDDIYWLIGVNINVGGITMSAKDSAHIILRAVAKKLNGDWFSDWQDSGQNKYAIMNDTWDETSADYLCKEVNSLNNFGVTVFKNAETAQKAIDILTEHFPEVLKNYLV